MCHTGALTYKISFPLFPDCERQSLKAFLVALLWLFCRATKSNLFPSSAGARAANRALKGDPAEIKAFNFCLHFCQNMFLCFVLPRSHSQPGTFFLLFPSSASIVWPLYFPLLAKTARTTVSVLGFPQMCTRHVCMQVCGLPSMCVRARTCSWFVHRHSPILSPRHSVRDGFWPGGEFLIKRDDVSVSTAAEASGSRFKRHFIRWRGGCEEIKSSLKLLRERNIGIEVAKGGNKPDTPLLSASVGIE